MQCPQCHSENPDQAKFCMNCGGKLALVCAACGTELPPQAKFCFGCGAALAPAPSAPDAPPPPPPTPEPPPVTPPAPPPARDTLAERLERLVPKEFAERLRAAGGRVQGERRIVTMLFSDIKGSTAMAEDMDPEDVMEIMDGAFDILIAPIYRHEGTLARLMGDAILAFFGAPIAHENDPERACRAALEIVAGAQAYASQLEREMGIRGFNVRVGINTGLVVVGEVGSDLRAEYTAMGDAVNLAARMEQAAPPGGILVSYNTYRHVRGLFEVQTLEPIAVKGKREPVQVYLVEEAKPRAFRLDTRGVEGIETQTIGREVEMARLQEALHEAIEHRTCRMVTITGDEGVGKSRLLYEFEKWQELQPRRFSVFRGRASQDRQSVPYALIRDLVAIHFQIQDSDPPEVVRTKMEQGIGDTLAQVKVEGLQPDMWAHFIGQLLGFDFSTSPYLREALSDAKQIRDRALIYLSEFFRAVAEQAPVLLFLEDIHWADGSSLDVIKQLALTASDEQLLIVCLARLALFERRPEWGQGQSHQQRINLQPLSEEDSQRLVAEILQRVQDVPDPLYRLIIERAEGNPLYVEELIKMLIEDGAIVKGEEEEPWQVELSRLADARVPPSLVGVLQARLDRLPLERRTILQRAAVVGRTFWTDAVCCLVSEAGAPVSPAVAAEAGESFAALAAKEMIHRQDTSAFAGTQEYAFYHAGLRDVTYENILRRVRRGYHGLVADWLIEHSGERVDEHAGLIAEHLVLARQSEPAIPYLRLAGERAASRYANGEAMDYFGRALQALEGASWPQAQMQEERYALLLGREAVYGLLGQREAQAADLSSLQTLVKGMDDAGRRAEVALRQAAYHRAVSQFDAALADTQEAVQQAREAGDPGLTAQGLVSWGLTLWQQGKFEESRQHLDEALALAREHNNRAVEASSVYNLGAVHYFLGDYEHAREHWQQAQVIRRELGDRRGEALSLNNLVAAYHGLGDLARGKSCGEEALAIYRLIGDRLSEGYALTNLGQMYQALGDLDTARDHYEPSLAIHRAVGDRRGEALTLKNLGVALHDLEDYEAARQHCEQALAIDREIGNRKGEGYSLSYLALALEGAGELQAAGEAFAEALALRREIGQEALAVDDLAGLARLALLRGEQAEAQDRAGEALAWIEEHGVQGMDYPVRVYLSCADVSFAAGEAERAAELLADVRQMVEEKAARISDPDTRRGYLERVPLHARLREQTP